MMTYHRAYRVRRRMLRAMRNWAPWSLCMAIFRHGREHDLSVASLLSESFLVTLLITTTLGTVCGLLTDHHNRPIGATIESD